MAPGATPAATTEPLRIDAGDRALVVELVDGALLLEEEQQMPRLTPREREILELVAEGRTNAEIAESLWVSRGTVRKHLDNVYAKLGVHSVQPPPRVVVAAIGLFLGFNALAPFMWKVTIPEAFASLFPDAADDFVRIGGAEWRKENIGVLVVLAVTSALLWLLFQRTKFGLAMRAVASNPESSPLVGIRAGQVLAVSWGLAAAVGAIGGALVGSLRGNVDASMMFTIFFAATAAATLGGYDSLFGAVFGGLVLGRVREHGGRLPVRPGRPGAEGGGEPARDPRRAAGQAVGAVRLPTGGTGVMPLRIDPRQPAALGAPHGWRARRRLHRAVADLQRPHAERVRRARPTSRCWRWRPSP